MVQRGVLLSCSVAVLLATGACSSSSGGGTTSAGASSSAGAGGSSAAAPSTSATSLASSGSGSGSGGGGGHSSVPATCKDIPTSLMLPYAKVALVQSFPRATAGVSCEFASANVTEIVILTIGPGSASSFAELEARTASAAVTTAPLHGVGQQAFTITRAGKVAGVDALTSDDVTVALGAALPAGQVQALAAKIVARY